ncbi:uncharacterized protein BKA78DRAFT_321610 [Phyllosticta capitalensis]|uniref:uncharacterized protein n=1 Tax=Phyllosticta capitalensis TaxID=121624 RepID=UPI00312DB690
MSALPPPASLPPLSAFGLPLLLATACIPARTHVERRNELWPPAVLAEPEPARQGLCALLCYALCLLGDIGWVGREV